MSIKPIPDGFHAITPYLFTQGAARLIEFISAAFDGELRFRETRPDGAIMHRWKEFKMPSMNSDPSKA